MEPAVKFRDAERCTTSTSIRAPALPYDFHALEPAISRDTLWHHFSLQERGCFEPAVELVRRTEFAGLDAAALVRATARAPGRRALHRFAAGLWSHDFYWRSMRPGGGGPAHGPVAERIEASFGGYGAFVDAFTKAALGLIGNGWLWLMAIPGALKLVTTSNTDVPLYRGRAPLIALDLWEHAYYLDHQNRRCAYVASFLEELIDWEFANRNLRAHEGTGPRGELGLDCG